VLLGHLQSDAIESRFGWLRQLAGANYYPSMRPLLEGDKNPGPVASEVLALLFAIA